MRKANVYMYNKFAGLIIEDEKGYAFSYDKNYLNSYIDNKSIDNIFSKFLKLETKMTNIIQKSFLPEDLKTEYIFLIKNNLSRL